MSVLSQNILTSAWFSMSSECTCCVVISAALCQFSFVSRFVCVCADRKDIRPVEITVPVVPTGSVLEQVKGESQWDNQPTQVHVEKKAVKMEVLSCVCRFIGELFKLKMLTEGIMHDCIRRLLRAEDEESLECLCRLLTTIGCDLDKDRSRVSMC